MQMNDFGDIVEGFSDYWQKFLRDANRAFSLDPEMCWHNLESQWKGGTLAVILEFIS